MSNEILDDSPSLKLPLDNKRKALDDPDAAKASKRIKNSRTLSPETEKLPVKVIPFPEKAWMESDCQSCQWKLADISSLARSSRGAQRRDRVQSGQQ